MVLLLQPGDKAETRGMPVAQLNGQKGTIMCYMESTGRYLFELDENGKTLSLRKANLKTEKTGDAAETDEAESVQAESVQAESVQAESVQAESVQAESVQAESVQAESVQAESVQAESVQAESVQAESVQAESVQAESVQAESVQAESVQAESVYDEDDDLQDRVDQIFGVNDIVIYHRVNGKLSRALVTEITYIGNEPRYAIRILSSGVEKRTCSKFLALVCSARNRREQRDNHPRVRQPNILEGFFFTVYDTIASASWPTLIVGFLGILWMWPNGDHTESPPQSSGSHYYWNWYGVVGRLGSVILVYVFAHKLGTGNGRWAFSWDRVWQRLMEMDFWELIRLAVILQVAMYFAANWQGLMEMDILQLIHLAFILQVVMYFGSILTGGGRRRRR